MSDDLKDLGMAVTLLQRLTEETLPKALEIKKRLDLGEKLDHWDLEFLHKLFERAQQVAPLIERHPEYQDVYASAIQLYKEITDQALINEKAGGGAT